MMNILKSSAVASLFVFAVFATSGCVDNSDPASTGINSAGAEVKKDEALAALLPERIASTGALKVGTDPSYPPNEFRDANGEIVGWNMDLAQAMADRLGLRLDLSVSKFDNVLPNVVGGRQDIGMASFTFTEERQKQVDFVNYYLAGSYWVSLTGRDIDPDNACGLKIAVQTGTTQDTQEIPERSQACMNQGKEPIRAVRFDGQDQVTNAVVLGQADAMSADSPVALYAVAQSGGKIEVISDLFDAAPTGLILQKDSEFSQVIQKTMQSLIEDGTYMRILKHWGVERGAVQEAVINAIPVGG